jgi:glycosyltransferase involved in cell wall biosynthesis
MTILGASEGRGHYRALFEALATLRDTGPGARFVLELHTGADQRIWRQLRRYDLTDLTTSVEEPVRMQRLLAATDLVLRPVPEHRVRPIILEAMAMGTPVVTVPEPWLDYLGPEQGATLLEQITPRHWEEALRPLMLDPDLRTAHGRLARQAMIEGHRSSARAVAIESLFVRVVGEEPIAMPSGG